ncbi:MAG: hypothetical protein NZ700_04875, partial [Gemmataceae bacterium]|nr:hypothetical protein [Gemmataceae bacterium]MDW8267471.1 hypothetical protein [Gemmataceae bacterium]
MMRRLLAVLALGIGFACLTLRAAEPRSPSADKPVASIKDMAALQQEILARQFREFEQSLLRLAQRMERSSKQEDRDKAAVLKQAIELASREQIDTRFDKLIALLKGSSAANLQEVQTLINDSEQLAQSLRAMLALLLSDNRVAALKAEEKRISDLIKEINRIIRDEKTIRAQNESGKVAPEELAKAQQRVTEATRELARAMGGQGKSGKAGESAKGEAKPGDAKSGEPKGESKSDSKDPKGDAKASDQNGKGGADPKGGDSKAGDAKAGDSKSGDPKAGDAKAGDSKSCDPKAGDAKAGDSKSGNPKAGDAKAGDSKSGDPKAGDAKAGDSKS